MRLSTFIASKAQLDGQRSGHMKLKISENTGLARRVRQAADLDPHKKVKDLLTHMEKVRDDINKIKDSLDLHVGDFYKSYPKTAEARKVMDLWHKKLDEFNMSTFRALGQLRKLDKQKE